MIVRAVMTMAGVLGGPLLQACILMSFAAWVTYYYLGSFAAFSLKDFLFVGMVGLSVLIHRIRMKSYIEHDPKQRLMDTAEPDPLEYFQGSPIHLGHDHVIALMFFGTWCKASRAALREFQKVYDKYNEAVHFIAVTQEDKEELNNYEKFGPSATYFTSLKEFNFAIATEDGTLTKAYQLKHKINQLPHVYVIGRDDTVFWHGHPDAVRRTLAYDFHSKVD
ncbi:hypothetical protein THRCLA_11556 [Thraustotheca clavata]|uniref:Thioredoxin domain-containing protein n=1 Tax=Thraustotheca clavata TaxID=74557 RepID=A0A1V9Y7C1_9STRA|nr:hypothetical protein THRCLA_11556 [Thraustotheca clavata]